MQLLDILPRNENIICFNTSNNGRHTIRWKVIWLVKKESINDGLDLCRATRDHTDLSINTTLMLVAEIQDNDSDSRACVRPSVSSASPPFPLPHLTGNFHGVNFVFNINKFFNFTHTDLTAIHLKTFNQLQNKFPE